MDLLSLPNEELIIRGSYQTDQIDSDNYESFDEPMPFGDHELVYHPGHCQPIHLLKSVEIHGRFLPITHLLTVLNIIGPNLEVLSIVGFRKTERILRVLSEKLPNIRRLKLRYTDEAGKQPCLNLGCLKNKINLMTYSLTNVLIGYNGIQRWLQMAPNLSKIALTSCTTLNDEHLLILASCCPQLQQLELTDCTKVTAQGLEEFRQILPHCVAIRESATNCDPLCEDQCCVNRFFETEHRLARFRRILLDI